jgi:DNA-binding MarR family transcriptional regulator
MEDDIHMRTYFNKILDFIKTITIINQFNREIVKNELIATKEDYKIAKNVLEKMSYGNHFKPMALKDRERLKRLRDYFGINSFTLTEAVNEFGLQKSTMSEHLTKLVNEGYIERYNSIDEFGNSKTKYILLVETKPELPNID